MLCVRPPNAEWVVQALLARLARLARRRQGGARAKAEQEATSAMTITEQETQIMSPGASPPQIMLEAQQLQFSRLPQVPRNLARQRRSRGQSEPLPRRRPPTWTTSTASSNSAAAVRTVKISKEQISELRQFMGKDGQSGLSRHNSLRMLALRQLLSKVGDGRLPIESGHSDEVVVDSARHGLR